MKRCVCCLVLLCGAFFSISSYAQTLNWTSTGGPYFTIVHTIQSAEADLYAATETGLYHSANNGNSWSIASGLTIPVNAIASNGSHRYIGGVGGFRLSTDNGATWVVRDSGLPQFSIIYDLKFSNDNLYASLGSEGFFRSTDEGKSWAVPSLTISGKTINSMIVTGTSLILAQAYGVLRSTNNGSSWDEEPGGALESRAVNVFIKNGTMLFAGTDGGVYRSADDGATWEISGTGIDGSVSISSMTISDDGKTLFAGTTGDNSAGGIYKSDDGGNTWQLKNSGLSTFAINTLFTSGNTVFAGTSLGISRSTNNGESWQIASSGLPMPKITSFTAKDYYVLAGTTGSYIFYSADKGDHWELRKSGLTRPNINTLFTFGNTIFAGTDVRAREHQGGIHRSSDDGKSWSLVSGFPFVGVHSFYYSDSLYVASDSGIYSSADNGSHWNYDSYGIPDTVLSIGRGPSTLLAGTRMGTFLSTNNGYSWLYDTAGIGKKVINAFVINKTNTFAATDSGIYLSVDNGHSWKRVSGDTINVRSLWANELIVAAGTTKGIYLSSNNGTSWQYQQAAGADSVNALYAANKNLYAGTRAGVIKAPLAEFGVKPASSGTPFSFRAHSASGITSIAFHNPSAGNVSLCAYDLLGRKCETITSEFLSEGEFDLKWNTSRIPSGTYILRLVAGGQRAEAIINIVR
jgi:photosystem II stability/assembly factor-like uncharacterized protein